MYGSKALTVPNDYNSMVNNPKYFADTMVEVLVGVVDRSRKGLLLGLKG